MVSVLNLIVYIKPPKIESAASVRFSTIFVIVFKFCVVYGHPEILCGALPGYSICQLRKLGVGREPT